MIIYTIGIGADQMTVRTVFGVRQINPSADLDEASLSAIAEMTGGQYFRATDTEELEKIYAILDELEPAESDEAGFRPVAELYFWPLGAAVLVALIGFLATFIPRRGARAVTDHG
jgi:Ca-activated chloride channel family protein